MSKNLHLQHPEDEILTGNLDVIEALYSHGNVSLKIDGCPAVAWGNNPATGNFFVGTKSVFNKKKLMINETHDDIEVNHGHQREVANILHHCLDHLPRTTDIIQGDFIGFSGSNIYKPNTLTYMFPEIVEQLLIIAPHTIYKTETTLAEAVSEPLMEILDDTEDIKWVQPSVDYVYQDQSAPLVNTNGIKFFSKKEAEVKKKMINYLIKEGTELSDSNLFGILDCPKLVNLYQLVIELKEELMDRFIVTDSPKAFLDDDGFFEVKGEGFVMSTPYGAFKLVDRETFSCANFTKGKFS